MQEEGNAPLPRNPPRTWRTPLRIVLWSLAALLLLYVASPYLSFWRFTRVLRSPDHQQMTSSVDFRAVRESLKQQLRARITKHSPGAQEKKDPFAGLVERLAPSLIDQLVDAFVTPDGLAALVADPELARAARAKDPGALARAGTVATKDAEHDFGWKDVHYAFFTGPRDFLIDLHGTKLRYRFSKFHWLLEAVELPLDDVNL